MHSPSDHPTDEDLIGYLMDSLDDSELARIEELLAASPDVRLRLSDLRGLILPLAGTKNEVFEPDHTLVGRTMELIHVYDRPAQEPPPKSVIAGLSSVVDAAHRTVRMAWVDSLALMAVGITLLCMLLPSVWYTREESRRFACSNNLREIGESLHRFTDTNQRHQFPKIETQGPMSFAGIYVVRLHEAGLLGSTQFLWCPTSPRATFQVSIPSTAQLIQAPVDLHDSWRRFVGGSYAYNLGILDKGIYRTPSSHDSDVPILGDLVCEEDIKANLRPIIHGACITNILYSDGKVRAVRLPSLAPSTSNVASDVDHPYLNRALMNAAGLDTNDWCLGPSHRSPLTVMPLAR
ncbi:hypothetical protein SH449x_002069 [Pirellulaceae bacterium SH449]